MSEYKIYCPWCGRPLTRHVGAEHRIDYDRCDCGNVIALRWCDDCIKIVGACRPEQYAALQAAAEKKLGADGYWWCPHCHEEVGPWHVTNQEMHTMCGYHVEWKELPDPAQQVTEPEPLTLEVLEAHEGEFADMPELPAPGTGEGDGA